MMMLTRSFRCSRERSIVHANDLKEIQKKTKDKRG